MKSLKPLSSTRNSRRQGQAAHSTDVAGVSTVAVEGESGPDATSAQRESKRQSLESDALANSRQRRRSRGLPLMRRSADESSPTTLPEQVTDCASADGVPLEKVTSRLENDHPVENHRGEELTEVPNGNGKLESKVHEESQNLLFWGGNGQTMKLRIIVNGQPVKNPSTAPLTTSIRPTKKVAAPAAAAAMKEAGKQSSRTGRSQMVLGHDGNNYFCHVCHGFGDVVCCDGCPNVYHPDCIPPEDPSRISLANDEDPWYCPDCMQKKPPPAKHDNNNNEKNRSEKVHTERRIVRPRCSECHDSGGDMAQCESCNAFLHHPSCRGDSPDGAASPLCSNCRAERVVSQEEIELSQDKEEELPEEEPSSDKDEITEKARRRTRSIDGSVDMMSEDEPMDYPNDEVEIQSPTPKRKRTTSQLPSALKKRGRPRLTDSEKKRRKKDKDLAASQEATTDFKQSAAAVATEEEDFPFFYSQWSSQGLPQATPAFFFFLSENRFKIERALARKHRYFNRLPKGEERNELVSKEGAIWWVKLRPVDHRRFLAMSMRDFEQRVIEWKQEQDARDMIVEADESDVLYEEDDTRDEASEDELLTYEKHERLYLSTSVGSKQFTLEPGQSHNRVLLELLQDMRFHPLPMFGESKFDEPPGESADSTKTAIPYFDVHGPVSTSVGDECLGCTRGWNHFCHVLKRRIPSIEHRAKLQPPLSSLVATRIGLGFRPRNTTTINQESTNGANVDLFSSRETQEYQDFKSLPVVASPSLEDPSNRCDDIVQFIEEITAMKIQEPSRPRKQGTTANDAATKSTLSRGVLPTAKVRKRRFSDAGFEPLSEQAENGKVLNKCGRCRTIVETDLGCIPCRRAQLVINMSKRQGGAASASSGKSDAKTSVVSKVQTIMLSRVNAKESVTEAQSESDRAVSNAILKTRWTPCAVMPPQTAIAPKPSSNDRTSSESSDGDSESSDDDQDDDTTSGGNDEEDVIDSDDHPANQDPSRDPEIDESKMQVTGRRQRSTRLLSAVEQSDRQQLAVAQKEQATELHKKSLSVACCGILLALTRRDPLRLFAQPVAPDIPGYTTLIKNPIDFGKIRTKVLGEQYTSLGAFVTDARLLCSNALAFNQPGTIYWKTAKELHDLLEIMQKRASNWMNALRDANASHLRRQGWALDVGDEILDDDGDDPFKKLRRVWPEALDMLENSDWLRNQLASDFMRTKENEAGYYAALAVRRAAAAAEASYAAYPDSGGAYAVVSKRSHKEDQALRHFIDDRVSSLVDPVQLKDVPSWREESIMRMMRRVQSRRLEGRIASVNGCARCDGAQINHQAKIALQAESFRWGGMKKKVEAESTLGIAASRLDLSTGLASVKTREGIEKHHAKCKESSGTCNSAADAAVSVRGSRIHGWGLFADQPFKKGDVVAEYVGEYVTMAVADAREKIYQEQRIQDYQFRLDDGLVIDATKKGGPARYINHNCNPNCIAKILPGEPPNERLRRVIIIAQRDIEAREEISYDYQFPLEELDQRIPCNCGSDITGEGCRGFLNWDMPERGSSNRAVRTQKRGGNMRDRIRRLGRPLKKVD